MKIEYPSVLHAIVIGHPSEELTCLAKAAELRAAGWIVTVDLNKTASSVPSKNKTGPTPLCVGDWQVTRILTQSRIINLLVKVPCSVNDITNADFIAEHARKNIEKAFYYLIEEGFITDRNYAINLAIIGG